jgi:hypothetical protein
MRNLLALQRRKNRGRWRAKYAAGRVSAQWRNSKPLRVAVGAASLALPVLVVASANASAGTNLLVNPGAEQTGGSWPVCWATGGYGTNTGSAGLTSAAHSGGKAFQVTLTSRTSGERRVAIATNASCAPAVTPGHQYDLGVWYESSTPNAVVEVWRHDVGKGWQFWESLRNLPVAGTYQNATVRTPAIPPNTDQISWGVALYGKGTLRTDDYSMTDATVKAAGNACSAGAACTKGVWQVMPFQSSPLLRTIHSVLMYNGKVLLVAGSGNDQSYFNAGTFESAVYDPAKGTFKMIKTPDDFFCSGHIQLPDGKVLVLGGNTHYPVPGDPTAAGQYWGANTSYVFNPVTDRYVREVNLIGGHWYPSATELGNGDIISLGGLNADGTGGDAAIEYFKYNPNAAGGTDGQWLNVNQVNQPFAFWGLYPDMILTQNGSLFYSGSHVFGNNVTPVGDPGTNPAGFGKGKGGAGFIDLTNILNPLGPALTTRTVTGLQDNPGGPPGTDMTDQSMTVLLPPAQDQKVLLMGGGNINTAKPGTRLTDLIDLNAATPTYRPGPLLPRGLILSNPSNPRSKLVAEPANDGKMYVNAVLLPNGQVLETGGGLTDRANPVWETSMYNPVTNRFTSMALDPHSVMNGNLIWRGYHSQAYLLPDGRVMSIGNNPGDGSFDLHISVYSPPYLFQGPRPQIETVATPTNWHYGKQFNITVNQKIVSAELIRPAAVTHQSDPNQRYVALPMSVHGNTIGLNVTNNPNMAPPGWYMLFVTNANGVPSVAKWVHVS